MDLKTFLVLHAMVESGKDRLIRSVLQQTLDDESYPKQSPTFHCVIWSIWSGTTDAKPHSSAKSTTYFTSCNLSWIWPLCQTPLETGTCLICFGADGPSITPTEAEMDQSEKELQYWRHCRGGWPHCNSRFMAIGESARSPNRCKRSDALNEAQDQTSILERPSSNYFERQVSMTPKKSPPTRGKHNGWQNLLKEKRI